MTKIKKSKNSIANNHYEAALQIEEESRDYPRVLRELQRAIEVDDKAPVFWFFRGEILSEVNQHSDAIKSYKKALELQDHPGLWAALGLCYSGQGMFKEGADAFTQALAGDVGDRASLYTLLARSQIEFDVLAAIGSAEKALAITPGWEEAVNVHQEALELLKKM